MMRIVAGALFALLLAACTTITRVDGQQLVAGKLAVDVPAAWNKVTDPWEREPYDVWTQDGLPIDHLRLWGGVASGKTLVARRTTFFRSPGEKDPRYPTFVAGVPADRLVAIFESLYAAEGTVQVTRVEPVVFAGEKGVRFEFTLVRRADDLVLKGVGWAAQHDAALYAMTFAAPRLAFYDRLRPMAEQVARSARIR
jgi:hypothetical protein